MNGRQEILVSKVVRSKAIKREDAEMPNISEDVKNLIRERGIESLEPLLGPDPQAAVRDLVEDYWRTK